MTICLTVMSAGAWWSGRGLAKSAFRTTNRFGRWLGLKLGGIEGPGLSAEQRNVLVMLAALVRFGVGSARSFWTRFAVAWAFTWQRMNARVISWMKDLEGARLGWPTWGAKISNFFLSNSNQNKFWLTFTHSRYSNNK